MNAMDTIFRLLLLAALVVNTPFVIIYATLPWYKSFVGRAAMIQAVGIELLLCFTVFFWIFGPGYFGREQLRLTGATFVVLGCAWQLYNMIKVYKRGNRETIDPQGESS